MDSVVGPSFSAAPLRSPSAVEGILEGADLEALAPCWAALTSGPPAHRAAALATVSHFRSHLYYRQVVADPKGWNNDEIRALYRCGLAVIGANSERRATMLKAIAQELASATDVEALMLYAVFQALLRPELDPGALRPLPDWRVLNAGVAQALALDEERNLKEGGRPATPIPVRPSLSAAQSAVDARRLLISLAEAVAVWARALRAEGGARTRAGVLREGLGCTPKGLAAALRFFGSRLEAQRVQISAEEAAPLTLEGLWSEATRFGRIARETSPALERLCASTQALCPWSRIPTANAAGLGAIFEHPLLIALRRAVLRRAERFSTPSSAAELEVEVAMALAKGLGGMPPLDRAQEQAIARACGASVPWSRYPTDAERRQYLRSAWHPRLARLWAAADFSGWHYETWTDADRLVESWSVAEPLRWTLGAWIATAILVAGAISYASFLFR